ncbi:pseudouridine synthase [Microbaculum sp. FT89]|uniref:pseudouridine synthase n=1 Tax=Microbaculum sp. FT89 TaxID=3447298 RepID=UPI003F52DF8E
MPGKTTHQPTPAAPERERIAKRIARSGLCSRRDAERLVAEGRVAVNGKVLDTPAFTVAPGDTITVNGAPLAEVEPTRLWLYHKPAGLVTTTRDPQGRATIFERLPRDLPRVMTIGRLDINTEGLLLLTNDGGLARVLELPATGWLRRYRVRAHGGVTQDKLDALKDGITIEGVRYGPIEATLDRTQGGNVWLTMGLREGKYREVKTILEALGLKVNRLIRVSFGPFMLRDLAVGAVEEVKPRVLRDQLGVKLARAANITLPEPTKAAAPQRGRDSKQGAPKPGGKPGPKPGAKPGAKPGRGPRPAAAKTGGPAKPAGKQHARRRRPV